MRKMKYETWFWLNYEEDSEVKIKNLEEKIINKLEELKILNWALDISLEAHNPVFWYKYRDDMKKISKCFPSVVFRLDGEDGYDKWREYWKNGKFHRAYGVVLWDIYDENKLVEYIK